MENIDVFQEYESETFSLQLPFLRVFLLVVFILTRTSHFFSGQKSGRRFLSLSLISAKECLSLFQIPARDLVQKHILFLNNAKIPDFGLVPKHIIS